ncbi:bifunctional enoyl-CoA hydratase/phosphate acetyltransferase [Oceanospirillaceae bacterium]|jgi:phosphate acetyltransferase|nr:bifunctional enoyl-CoA hydratase/phosphate acetyltransferase [Oceanospirillaceae bacterium]MBT6102211.1 bifunctional enoyl-CoA hydratase/phosphate acetyltransferase [Oceanospirillaceae bacterium]MDB4214437.1 bifunctional enoyl-CoA hydratase/phosphate acetyltransferase [Oceanospirillaceae bacterium]MDB4536310.1 bifunctional enoyl-CoA hydratase/phosphate acetyltransferase [Oceanospirillaceae bacterium]MDB9905359.1 bifunctional enoyl-CoA hydratase/phosphate acetyltransferase [Oceanospirillaceae
MLSQLTPVCPQPLLNQAQALPAMATAVVNAGSELALESAKLAFEASIIVPILVGNIAAIQKAAQAIEWNIDQFELIASESEEDSAAKAVQCVHQGMAKLLMKGHLHTDVLIRALLNKEHGLRTGERLSHLFHMSVPDSDRVLCITDAVVNVSPDTKTQLSILRGATDVMHALGNLKPKVALLSATEVVTQAMPSSMAAKELLAAMSDQDHQAADVFGPLAFDGAMSPEAAKIKGITHSVAGHADVLLVPNIETGNAIFKQLVYFNGATAAGVLMGAKVPVILTSRADPPAARLASAALAVVYAHYLSEK